MTQPETLPGTSILPGSLDALLRQLQNATAKNVVIKGFGGACADNDHVLEDWITGFFIAPGKVGIIATVQRRFLVLRVCVMCEMVQVRDRTVTTAPLRSGGRMKDTPDIHLGWYTGSRRNRRTYH